MDALVSWIQSNQVVAWIGSLVIAIPAVWKLIEKFSPKIRRALKISKEVMDLLNELLDALEDHKITKEEIESIMAEVAELQAALK